MTRTRTNQEWRDELEASGPLQEAAIADLRDLLLRAALYFFSHNLDDLRGLDREEILQRAEDCAQNALLLVLEHLPDFRGDSKFTTWAYKFAINVTLTTARRERWNGISLDALASQDESYLFEWMMRDLAEGVAPEQSALQAEVKKVIRDVIQHDLSDQQRDVLSLMILNEVPLDEVVRHLGTNRNAVYKMLHDARRKLKSGLLAHGFEVGETLTLFKASR
jgi:RNA polymerase sigma-70 factor, ECF subfamily